MKKGDVVNFTKIKDGMEQLRKFYHGQGFIAVEMLPNQRVDDEQEALLPELQRDPGRPLHGRTDQLCREHQDPRRGACDASSSWRRRSPTAVT